MCLQRSSERIDWSELAQLIITGATDGRDVGCQRQLTVDDNTEVTSGARDGDASAEHQDQDVTAVNLVQQLTRAELVGWFFFFL